jgi:hypothetical protein
LFFKEKKGLNYSLGQLNLLVPKDMTVPKGKADFPKEQ